MLFGVLLQIPFDVYLMLQVGSRAEIPTDIWTRDTEKILTHYWLLLVMHRPYFISRWAPLNKGSGTSVLQTLRFAHHSFPGGNTHVISILQVLFIYVCTLYTILPELMGKF